MSNKIEVMYNGEYPALCMGDLVIVVDGKEWKFPNSCLSSGGSAGVDGGYNEYCYYGDWSIDEYPEGFPEEYPNDDYKLWGTELTLFNKEYFPIRTYQFFEHSLAQELKDPIAALMEIMGKMKKGEHVWVQLVLTPIMETWKENGIKAIKKMMGQEVKSKPTVSDKIADSVLNSISYVSDAILGGIEGGKKEDSLDLGALKMSPGEVDQIKAIESKISKIGFRTKIRIIYLGRPEVFSKAKGLVSLNMQFSGR